MTENTYFYVSQYSFKRVEQDLFLLIKLSMHSLIRQSVSGFLNIDINSNNEINL